MGSKVGLIQLICTGGLSRPTLQALIASLGDLMKGNSLRQQFEKTKI